MGLTHIDEGGKARMVDVGGKAVTERVAVARGRVLMKKETLELILANEVKKGDVLGVARVAGIMAAKKTSELIPLCHPLNVTSVEVEFETLNPTTGDTTMTVYVIADIKVTDNGRVPAYTASAHDLVHKHGGKYVPRSGNVRTLEGKPLDTTLIARHL